MLSAQMFALFRRLLDDIEREETEAIAEAAEQTARAIAAGHKLFVYDRGHLLNHELFQRAGGLALLRPLPIQWPSAEGGIERELQGVKEALQQCGMQEGDVLMLGSVSGRAANLIELAIQARHAGIHTIAVTSLAYSSQTPSQHPSGRRLFEICDHVLDIHTGKGDAALTIEGIEEKVIPTSGITSAVVAWAFVACLIERLLQRGIKPSVYRSVSLPKGMEQIEATNERFAKLGY